MRKMLFVIVVRLTSPCNKDRVYFTDDLSDTYTLVQVLRNIED